jgi:probable phosphoglycerate mutase
MGKGREQGTGIRDQERRAEAAAPGKRVVLEGYVKGGVVHLLEGELPDGVFVKVIREG